MEVCVPLDVIPTVRRADNLEYREDPMRNRRYYDKCPEITETGEIIGFSDYKDSFNLYYIAEHHDGSCWVCTKYWTDVTNPVEENGVIYDAFEHRTRLLETFVLVPLVIITVLLVVTAIMKGAV